MEIYSQARTFAATAGSRRSRVHVGGGLAGRGRPNRVEAVGFAQPAGSYRLSRAQA
jgi:hypothetical protein